VTMDEESWITLDQLTPGVDGVVREIDGEGAAVRRLMDLGLVPGTLVQHLRKAPLGDPLEILVRGMHLSIRRSEAGMVHVEPV
jgi:ferrous iron transport protein A